MNARSGRTSFCDLGGDMTACQRTLAMRTAAITLASDSAITLARFRPSKLLSNQNLSGDPNPQYFLAYKWEANCRTNGRRTAVQMGGVLLGFPFFEARSQEGTAIQMWGVLPYTWEACCSTLSETSRGWGFWTLLIYHRPCKHYLINSTNI